MKHVGVKNKLEYLEVFNFYLKFHLNYAAKSRLSSRKFFNETQQKRINLVQRSHFLITLLTLQKISIFLLLCVNFYP